MPLGVSSHTANEIIWETLVQNQTVLPCPVLPKKKTEVICKTQKMQLKDKE